MGHYKRGEDLKPIISPNIRARYPQFFSVQDHSIVDDFCYFSTKIKIGKFSHVASGCSIAGGTDHQFRLGDFSSLSSGVKIWVTSNDFSNDIVTFVPVEAEGLQKTMIKGDVVMGNFTAVGTNSVIMPNNKIPEGVVIGALSFVPSGFKFKPWSVYVGIPIKFIKRRNKKNVLKQAKVIESIARKK